MISLDPNIAIPILSEPDKDGMQTLLGYVPGYHVNTTVADLAEHPELEPFVVVPSTMRRVWAGDDPENPQWTVALKFADEAEARAVLGLDAPE